jgi:hypothetical protein
MFLLMLVSVACAFFALKYFFYFCRVYLEGVPVQERVIGYRGTHEPLPVLQAEVDGREMVFTLERKLPSNFMPARDGKVEKISFSRFDPSKSLVGCYSRYYKINYVYALAFQVSSQYFFKVATNFERVIGTGTFVFYLMCAGALYYLFRFLRKRTISAAALQENIARREQEMESACGPVEPVSPLDAARRGREALLLNLRCLPAFIFLFLFCFPLAYDEGRNLKVEKSLQAPLSAVVGGFEWAGQPLPLDLTGFHRYQMLVTLPDGARLPVASRPENFFYKPGDVVKVMRTRDSGGAFVTRHPSYVGMGNAVWWSFTFVFLTLSVTFFCRMVAQASMLFREKQPLGAPPESVI